MQLLVSTYCIIIEVIKLEKTIMTRLIVFTYLIFNQSDTDYTLMELNFGGIN